MLLKNKIHGVKNSYKTICWSNILVLNKTFHDTSSKYLALRSLVVLAILRLG